MINIKGLVKSGTDYFMDFEFQRIKKGERIGVSKQPYSIKLYDNLILYYENLEDYEKCAVILIEKNKIFDHDNNYKIFNICRRN
jgi:hypothetical protein